MKLIVKFFFLFFFYTLVLPFWNTAPQPHRPFLFSPFALSFLSIKPLSSFVIFFVLLSFSVVTEGYMNGSCGSCIFDRINQADILPWTRAAAALYLHWSSVAVQVKTLTQNWESLTCSTAISVKISIHYTYYSEAVFINVWCMCAYSFITLGHRGDQTSNPASVTVTLLQLGHTEGFLAWDYSKIFCSTGPNSNMNSSSS